MKKDKCCECKKETTNRVDILTGKDWKYETYCLQCARSFFSFMSSQNLSKLPMSELRQCSYEWDNIINQNTIKIKMTGKDWSQVPFLMKKLQRSKSEGNPTTINKLIDDYAFAKKEEKDDS